MKIYNNSNNLNFERRKIPRYIYHFTNEHAYNSILKDGCIKTSSKDSYAYKEGIFAVELSNLINFWGRHKDWGCGIWDEDPLSKSLFRKVAKWINVSDSTKNNVVVLKIPTDKLDLDNLAIRSQHIYFKHAMIGSKWINKKLPEKIKENLTGKTMAFSKFGRQLRKHKACEYIYYKNVPLDLFEKVGNKVNMLEIRKSDNFKKYPVRTILENLFDNTKEAEGVKFLEL